MKESRLIIIVSLCLFVLIGPIFYLLYLIQPNLFDYMNIATNLYCGIVVGLITSICQYCASRRKIINDVYNAYFDVYRSYYYANNKPFLLHYDTYSVYKKITDLSPKIVESLDEYQGFFKKIDKTYRKLNPLVKYESNYKSKNILKSILLWNNKKTFDKTFNLLIDEIEKILIDINEKRFLKDKEAMISLFNYCISKEKKN